MSKKADWLAIVGAVLLFLALIGLIIVFRRSRTVILPTSRKWEIHRQVQGEKEVRKDEKENNPVISNCSFHLWSICWSRLLWLVQKDVWRRLPHGSFPTG